MSLGKENGDILCQEGRLKNMIVEHLKAHLFLVLVSVTQDLVIWELSRTTVFPWSDVILFFNPTLIKVYNDLHFLWFISVEMMKVVS